MGLLSWTYKRILERLNLSNKELTSLKKELTTDKICAGPHIRGNKSCPVTKALNIKIGRKMSSNEEVSKNLRKFKVSRTLMILFYLVFDIPSMVSRKYLERSLKIFREK